MRVGADPGDRHADCAGLFLRPRDQLSDRPNPQRGTDRQHRGVAHEHRNRREIPHRIVGKIRAQTGIDRERTHRAEEQTRPVGHRLGDDFSRDSPVRPRLVLDNDALANRGACALGQQAGHEIGRAAGRERHDHPYRTRRQIMRAVRVPRGATRSGQRWQGGGKNRVMLPRWRVCLTPARAADKRFPPNMPGAVDLKFLSRCHQRA